MGDLEFYLAKYAATRALTEELAGRLAPDDQIAQSMPDASPTKWHLAHTTWFFDRMLLAGHVPGHAVDERFDYLFNSYYEAVGERQPRALRSLLTRPTLDEVKGYRASIDASMAACMKSVPAGRRDAAIAVLELGIHHEQQHQELILTDVKHLLGSHPDRPAYAAPLPSSAGAVSKPSWVRFEEGVVEIGHRASDGFAFDNEGPRHRVFVDAFEIASRPITQGEYLEFVEHGGYDDPTWWLSDGWHASRSEGWRAPLYWCEEGGSWQVFTLRGVEPLRPELPVCHVSFYEADAFARYCGARLPTEAEWELAASTTTKTSPTATLPGNFVDSSSFHPSACLDSSKLSQLFGDVWEWTASPYVAYPRFAPLSGALGEYNGKFMCNQLVLRGGSCLSSRDHLRVTYRNFFPPNARWQMSGLRLARWT